MQVWSFWFSYSYSKFDFFGFFYSYFRSYFLNSFPILDWLNFISCSYYRTDYFLILFQIQSFWISYSYSRSDYFGFLINILDLFIFGFLIHSPDPIIFLLFFFIFQIQLLWISKTISKSNYFRFLISNLQFNK